MLPRSINQLGYIKQLQDHFSQDTKKGSQNKTRDLRNFFVTSVVFWSLEI